MTTDYIEDAMDSLEKGGHCHILISAVDDYDPRCLTSTCVHNMEQLDWFKRRFDETYEKLKSRFES